MLLKRHFEKLLLQPGDVEPSREDFEVVGAFNPGAIRAGDEVILLVRVAERPRERRPGFTASPRWVPGQGLTIDWLPDDSIDVLDPRVVQAQGRRPRPADVHLALARGPVRRRSFGGRGQRRAVPARFGDGGIRCRGPADHGAGRSVLFHVCRGLAPWRGDGAGLDGRLPPLRAARDHLLPREQGRGPVPGTGGRRVRGAPSAECGDAVLPARDVGGALARPDPMGPSRLPARRRRRVGDRPRRRRDAAGAGRRWLARDLPRQPPADPSPARSAGTRRASLLLDPDNPAKILRRTAGSVFEPTAEFERDGFVPDVVFPTGIVEAGDSYLVYYGAADSCTAVVEFARSEVLSTLSG